MKKRITILLVMGVLLIPLLVRTLFPSLYSRIWENYPIYGFFLVLILDIVWIWVALFGAMVASRIIRRIRKRPD
nr:hypothetical protein [Spirosoma sp. KNUC1025]